MLKSHALFCILIALTVWLLPTFSDTNIVSAQVAPSPGAEECQSGIELYRQKNFVEAAKVLKNAVKKHDRDEEAWYYLGLALTPQPKELKNATKPFETAIKLKPTSAAAHTGLSYVLLRRTPTTLVLFKVNSICVTQFHEYYH